jgi:hypothetical protein
VDKPHAQGIVICISPTYLCNGLEEDI